MLFSSALKVTKQSAKSWDYFGGTIFWNGGDLVLAEAALRRALKLEPQYTPAYSNLVRLLKKEGKFEDAIEVRSIKLISMF